jgi:hypothetical protein
MRIEDGRITLHVLKAIDPARVAAEAPCTVTVARNRQYTEDEAAPAYP